MDLSKVFIKTMDEELEVDIPKDYYQNTSILKLPTFKISLKINKDNNQDYHLLIISKLKMILQDAITLKEVEYPFSLNIVEKITDDNENLQNFIKKQQNTLDIIGVLWENIVLEIPISYRKSKLENEYHDGWELVGESKKEQIDPRLAPLLELYNDEKE